jgi:hypothetical protein
MKNQLPDYQEKQKILYIDRRSAEELIVYGDRSLEEDCIFDALEFYQKAKHMPGLQKILEAAISIGDTMLFEQTVRALRREYLAEEWNRLGQRAFALKKYTFARHAFEQVGDNTMLEEIRKITTEGMRTVDDNKT